MKRREREDAPGRRSPGINFLLLVLFVAALLVAGAVRIRLLGTPLERDEGEYAYAGQLLLQGSPPYAHVYNMKFPGTYVAYALIEATFGETIEGIHFGLLLLNMATVILLFLVGRRLLGTAGGVVAGTAYALLSLSPSVLGTSAHATHFVVLPAMVGLLLLLDASESGRLSATYLSGLMFGLACLMKQHAIFFAAFALLFFCLELLRHRTSLRARFPIETVLLTGGLATPLAFTLLILWWAGVWDSFWFWTFSYAREYVSIVTPSEGLVNLGREFPRVVGPSVAIWVLAAVGLVAAIRDPEPFRKRLLLLFAGFSALTVCPGLYFRPHYFVTALPAVALLAAAGVSLMARGLSRASGVPWEPVAMGIAALALGTSILSQYSIFVRFTPLEVSRAMYGLEPFPEAVEIGHWLRAQPGGKAPVLVLGAEPEIYFYSGRRSATGYIYVYSVWENQIYADSMMRQMIREVEDSRPQYVIVEFVPKRLEGWTTEFLNRSYILEGRVDIISHHQTEYVWGAEARTKPRRARRYLYIFKRVAE
jgi:hypothetical protein